MCLLNPCLAYYTTVARTQTSTSSGSPTNHINLGQVMAVAKDSASIPRNVVVTAYSSSSLVISLKVSSFEAADGSGTTAQVNTIGNYVYAMRVMDGSVLILTDSDCIYYSIVDTGGAGASPTFSLDDTIAPLDLANLPNSIRFFDYVSTSSYQYVLAASGSSISRVGLHSHSPFVDSTTTCTVDSIVFNGMSMAAPLLGYAVYMNTVGKGFLMDVTGSVCTVSTRPNIFDIPTFAGYTLTDVITEPGTTNKPNPVPANSKGRAIAILNNPTASKSKLCTFNFNVNWNTDPTKSNFDMPIPPVCVELSVAMNKLDFMGSKLVAMGKSAAVTFHLSPSKTDSEYLYYAGPLDVIQLVQDGTSLPYHFTASQTTSGEYVLSYNQDVIGGQSSRTVTVTDNSACIATKAPSSNTILYCSQGCYISADLSSCVALNDIPANYGADVVSGMVNPCSPGCNGCSKSNYKECTACQAGYAKFKGAPGCYPLTQFPAGMGAKVGTAYFDYCDPSLNCASCINDITKCDTCSVAGQSARTDGKCMDFTTDTAENKGWGRNSATGKYEPCTPANNCLTCRADYSKCTTCDNAHGLYLTSAKACKTLQMGYAAFSAVAGVEPVQTACDPTKNCGTCSISGTTTTCLTCDQSTANTIVKFDGTCSPFLSPGYRLVNPTTGTTEACKPSNCIACTDNADICTMCLPGYALHKDNQCYTFTAGTGLDTEILGFGLRPGFTPIQTEGCTTSLNCLGCNADSTSCTTCPTNYGKVSFLATGTIKYKCILMNGYDAPENIGYGKDTTVATYTSGQPCAAGKNCATCINDYTMCSSCDTANGYYLSSDFVCRQNTDGWGKKKDATTGLITLEVCTSANNCKGCWEDYTKCSTCTPTEFMFLYNGACLSAVPQGAVDNPTTHVLSPCTVVNCATCDFTSQNTCLTCSVGYYYDAASNKCLNSPNTGFGINQAVSPNIIVPCDPSLNCLTCAADYQSCDACNTNFALFTPTTPGAKTSCIYSKEDDVVNAGKGIDSTAASPTLKACSQVDCQLCLTDYTKCTKCTTTGNYVFPTDGSCKSVAPGFGVSFDTSTGIKTIAACDPTKNCATCENDYQVCTSCTGAFYLYTDTAGMTTCIDTSSDSPANAGKGKDIASTSQVLKDCDPTKGCSACLSDYTKCSACQKSGGTPDPTTFTCPLICPACPICPKNTFTPITTKGLGLDTTNGRSKACETSNNCLACEDNYKKCTECHDGFELIDYVCRAVALKSGINNDGKSTMLFKRDVSNVDTDHLDFTIIDLSDKSIYNCPPSECKAMKTSNSNAISFELKPKKSILRGAVSVVRSKTATRMLQTSTDPDPFANPVVIEDAQFTSSQLKISAYTGLFTVANTIRFFSTLGLSYFSSSRAFFSTEIFSTLFYFSVLEGPLLAYTQRFLEDHMNWKLLVVNFGNPFRHYNEYCVPSEEYPKNHLHCNFLTNYGQNFIILLCIFTVSFFVSLYLRFTSKTEESSQVLLSQSESDLRPQWRRGLTNLGLAYLYGLTDALKIPIFIFVFEQYRSFYQDSQMRGGLAVSILISMYYLVCGLLTLRLADEITEVEKKRLEKSEWKGVSLERVMVLDHLKLGVFKHSFDGIEVPSARLDLAGPLFEYLRAILISSMVVFFPDNANAAISFILGVEIVMLGYRLMNMRKQVYPIHSVMNITFSTLTVAYLLLRLISLASSVKESSRQGGLSVLLTILLFGFWILILADVIYEILRMLYLKRGKSTNNEAGSAQPVERNESPETQGVNGTIPANRPLETEQGHLISPELNHKSKTPVN